MKAQVKPPRKNIHVKHWSAFKLIQTQSIREFRIYILNMAELNVPDPLLSRLLFSSSPESVRYPGFSPMGTGQPRPPLPSYKDIWCPGFSAPGSWSFSQLDLPPRRFSSKFPTQES